MPYIETQNETGQLVNIFYQDLGSGKPVILIHGWPVSHEMWEYQLNELPKRGFRCIAYDRRGFGKSDKPWGGYDYTTLANDLKSLIDELELEEVTLVGFSMGGGEVIRYCSLFNCENISKIVLVSAVTPYLLKTDTNPEGVEKEMFDEMSTQLANDRPAFLSTFGKQFFGVDWISHPVSTDILTWMQNLALAGSGRATSECLKSFATTDFRDEMSSVTVPALVIHGNSDKTVPIEPTGAKSALAIPGALYNIYDGAPHGLFITEKQRLTEDLTSFISSRTVSTVKAEFEEEEEEHVF